MTARGLVGRGTRGLALALALAAGCAAPPLAIGSGARIPAPPGMVSLEGRTSSGFGPGRYTYQAEVSGSFRLARWFGLEGGAVYTRVSQDVDGGGTLVLNGAFPYVRPRFFARGASLAIGLAGLGMGGGGGGIIGGIADAQLGYGTDAWGAYVGGYRHYFELVAEDAVEASATNWRVGGQYGFPVGRGRLGVALELHRQRDDLRNDPYSQSSRLWAGVLKLSYTSPSFR